MKSWYDEASVGLFIHWGINTQNEKWEKKIPRYKTIEEFENAVNDNGWTAEKWVSAAKKLHASYITLAIFHCALGYIKAWKSDIPATRSTKRDFLGELIAEAQKENIKILLYISGDAKHSNYFPDKPWIFPKEYCEYKNDDTINIIDMKVWQSVYAKEIIGELIDKYPLVAGFWFDGWNSDSLNSEIFGYIHQKNPELVIIKNNFSDHLSENEDIMSLECFGKVYEPSFDFPSATWVDTNKKECCYVMRELSDWWQWYEPTPYDKNELIRKFITITTNGWVAKMGLGPTVGGDFNSYIGEFIDDIDDYLSWAEKSIFHNQAGTFCVGSMNDGSYVTSCSSKDEKTFYVHTLLPPKNNILTIPDGGRIFKKATNLKSGEDVEFVQENGILHIKENFSEYCDKYSDTVIMLESSGNKVAEFQNVNEYLKTLPTETKILNTFGNINGILLRQDDTSASSKGSWAAPENNRGKNYEVFISSDDISYKIHAKGELSCFRGIKQINFEKTNAKYIKLNIISAYDTTSAYIKKFEGATWSYLPYKENIKWTKEVIIGTNKYICDKDGTVCGWGDNGNNIYVICPNAEGIAMDTDSKLIVKMPTEKGKLRISELSLLKCD